MAGVCSANGLAVRLSILILFCFTCSAFEFKSNDGLYLNVSSDGSYVLSTADKIWLTSADTYFTVNGRQYGTDDETLILVNAEVENGVDRLGEWTAQALYYKPQYLDVTVKCIFKVYDGLSAVFFGQHFLNQINGSSSKQSSFSSSSAFPSFLIPPSSKHHKSFHEHNLIWRPLKSPLRDQRLGFLAFGDYHWGNRGRCSGNWNAADVDCIFSGLESGPLVLFNHEGESLILSSFVNPMDISAVYEQRHGQMTSAWGIMGNVSHVPKDYAIWTTIVYSSRGIRQTFEDWGGILRKYYNRHTQFRDSDLVNNYLGYWTDNGAYYYYNTEQNMTYEDTLIKVKEYADSVNIPYRYIQYDSWWYYKGPEDGVTEWLAMPEVFPNGLNYLWNKTGLPIIAHNRWWSDATVYAKQNGGDFDFIIERDLHKSFPTDPNFWDYLMRESKKWGLLVYEQDWLNEQFDGMLTTTSTLGLGRQWLRQMGDGAAKNGLTIQYCMAPCRNAIQSLEIPVVSQARVSDDYKPGNYNWQIGVSSLFADAMGVAPFKDNFWSTSNQPDNVYNLTEKWPELQAVVSTLSAGPVGPSDKIGYSDVELILRSCNSDGLLLKPSRPAKAVDQQIMRAAFEGFKPEIWSTYSDIGPWRFGMILAANMTHTDAMDVSPTSASLLLSDGTFPESVIYSWHNANEVHLFSDLHPLHLQGCSNELFCLFISSPVFKIGPYEVILLGELNKWVPMSPKRMTHMTLGSDELKVTLTGNYNEVVVFTYTVDGHRFDTQCIMDLSGIAILSVMKQTC